MNPPTRPLSAPSAQPIVCGHRGVPGAVRENTIASFIEAQARGATWVEFDVRPTADGVLAIHHDPVTSDGVRLASTAFADLDDAIPRFGDLVAACPDLGLDVEMKTDDIDMGLQDFAALVVREIAAHCDSTDNVMVTSFDEHALRHVRDLDDDQATGFLFWDRSIDEALAIAEADGHQAIAPSIRLLTDELVAKARAQSLGVATWTVNDPSDIARAAALGVDMIIGDDPAVICSVLAAGGPSS